MYNVVEQERLDILRKDVIEETQDAYRAKLFKNDAVADRLSKKLLSSSSLTAPIATIVRRRTDTTIADQNAVFAKASKKDPWQPRNHLAVLSKNCKANRTPGARSPTVAGIADVYRRARIQCVKNATLREIRTLRNCRTENTTSRQCRNEMMRYYRLTSNTTSTVVYEIPGRKVIHPLTALEKLAASPRKIYRSSALSMIGSGKRYITRHTFLPISSPVTMTKSLQASPNVFRYGRNHRGSILSTQFPLLVLCQHLNWRVMRTVYTKKMPIGYSTSS